MSSENNSPPTSGRPKSLSGIIQTVALVAIVGVIGYAVLQRLGFIGGMPIDAQVAATVGGSYPTKKPKALKAYLSEDDPKLKIDDMPPGKWKIVDIHEHVQNEEEAVRLLHAMDKVGVQRVALQSATIYTFTLNNKYGFEQYEENNKAIIDIKKKWPDRFSAFITFDPLSPTHLDLVKKAVADGADGVKLFIGHGAATGKGPFHVMPIDDARLEPFWAYAEETQLPVLMHVNLIKYWDETISLLEKHPNLRLCLPHFGLHKNTEARLARLGWILDRYPNVYSDMSYGYYTFQIEGFEALSKYRTRSRLWLQKYAHKLMFASDMVLEKTKTEEYIIDTLRSYRQWNEMKALRLYLVPSATMHGMELDDDSLKKIYEVAPANFLLTDATGALPDRTKGPPAVDRKTLPPIDLESIPDDTQYVPRTDGKAYGSAKSLARAASAKPAGDDDKSETKGGGGEGPEGDHAGHADCEGEGAAPDVDANGRGAGESDG